MAIASCSAGGCRERKQWECRTCTYLNLPHLLRCELCDVPRLGPLSAHAAGTLLLAPARFPLACHSASAYVLPYMSSSAFGRAGLVFLQL